MDKNFEIIRDDGKVLEEPKLVVLDSGVDRAIVVQALKVENIEHGCEVEVSIDLMNIPYNIAVSMLRSAAKQIEKYR